MDCHTVRTNQTGCERVVMPDRDEESGRYTDDYPTEDFLQAISNEGGVAGTGEIAERVGCAHDTAYKRLQKIVSETRKSKPNLTVMWARKGNTYGSVGTLR